jgi:DNA-directed RNA polymerase specialized sigma24 family protein
MTPRTGATESPTKVAARVIRRKWDKALSAVLDKEDYDQQAELILLEGLGTPDPNVREDVWVIGKLVRNLNDWCRKLYRRLRHEVTTSFQEDDGDEGPRYSLPVEDAGIDWIDAVDTAQTFCTPDEYEMVMLLAAGYRHREIAEKLGWTEGSSWTRLTRLRVKVKEATR